jgi:putative aminopeptidase FrvX
VLDTIIQKTSEYLSMPCVVGHEQFFMDFLKGDLKNLGLSVYETDGILEVHGNAPRNAIICAHIDRHGLISLGDDEYVYAAQYMREIKYGENNKSSREQLESIAKRFEGEKIYAYHPESGEVLSEDALFYVEGLGVLEQNIPLAYARQASFENGLLKGQIDNVISIAVIYALFKAGYQGTVLLTCEEEIGKSWIHIASYLDKSRIETQNLIILDTSPYSDQSIIDAGTVILRNRDKSEMFNASLVRLLKDRCDDLKMPVQIKDEYLLAQGKDIGDLGSTELGRLIEGTNGTWSGATVQIPTLMYHTSNETTSTKAIENYYLFLRNILIEDALSALQIKDIDRGA